MVFGFGGNNNGFIRTIVPFDTRILANALTPNVQNANSSNIISPEAEAIARRLNSGPTITPPWRLNEDPPPLLRRVNEARNLRNFIDLGTDAVQSAGNNPDRRATFTLFQALEHLQALALFAGNNTTPETSLKSLDDSFQRGLSQINQFLQDTELDKLQLFFGDRDSSVESKARIAANPTSYRGEAIQNEKLSDPVPGLKGDERFSITLKTNKDDSDSDVIIIDLSEITSDLTLTAINDLINRKIQDIPRLDSNDRIERDAGGKAIPKYRTRFRSERDPEGGFFIGVSGSTTEKVSLSALSATPSAYIASNFEFLGRSNETATRITRIDALTDEEFVVGSRNDYNSTDIEVSELNRQVAEAEFERRSEQPGRNDQSEFEAPADIPFATRAGAIATYGGNVYVVGTTSGDLSSHLGDGEDDVFLSKFDSNGKLIFERLLATRGEGSSGTSQGVAVTVDTDGNIIIAGQTSGTVSTKNALKGNDSFVVKYDPEGNEVFRYQLDTLANDGAVGITTDSEGDIFVTGFTDGNIGDGTSNAGRRDAYILRLSGDSGQVVDRTQFGTNGSDQPTAIAQDNEGNIFVTSTENGKAIVRKISQDDLSDVKATYDLGDLGGGKITSLQIFDGQLILGGTTSKDVSGGGTFTNQRGEGTDGFVSRLTIDENGFTPVRTTYIGSDADDSISSIQFTVDNDAVIDKIYISGTTNDKLPGGQRNGRTDTFFVRLDAETGAAEVTQQLGLVESRNTAVGSVLSFEGEEVLGRLGLRTGELTPAQRRDITSETTVKDRDEFSISINGGLKRRIQIRAGDTLRSLAFRINALGFSKISARPATGRLAIRAQDDTEIEFFAGPKGRDALNGLGIEPGKITATNILLQTSRNSDQPEDTLGGIFGLKLEESFNIRDKQTARFVSGRIDDAIRTVQRAFRSLSFDPIAFTARTRRNTQGPVPEFLTNQIANYQAALDRLTAGSQAGGPNVFI